MPLWAEINYNLGKNTSQNNVISQMHGMPGAHEIVIYWRFSNNFHIGGGEVL